MHFGSLADRKGALFVLLFAVVFFTVKGTQLIDNLLNNDFLKQTNQQQQETANRERDLLSNRQ